MQETKAETVEDVQEAVVDKAEADDLLQQEAPIKKERRKKIKEEDIFEKPIEPKKESLDDKVEAFKELKRKERGEQAPEVVEEPKEETTTRRRRRNAN